MRRRTFLGASGLALAPWPARARQAGQSQATFVLVHGAWHSSAHWARVVAPLSAHGHRVVTLDLPGHGVHALFPPGYWSADRSAWKSQPSPLAGLTLEDAAEAVLTVLRSLPGPRILVGHSMAGHVIGRVAEREPELVSQLVYLSAFMPIHRPAFADYLSLPEAGTEWGHTVTLGDPAQLGAARIDPRSQDPDYHRRLRLGFYGDVDEPTYRAFVNTLTPDQPVGYFMDSPRVTGAAWGRVKRSYLLLEKDGAMAPALQRLFIREADELTPANPTRVVRLASSHSPFASMPEELARSLAALAQ